MKARWEDLVDIREESLERMMERVERRHSREEEDHEVELDEMIDRFADSRSGPIMSDGEARSDEFVCRRCHFVEHRSRMAKRGGLICVDCAEMLVGSH